MTNNDTTKAAKNLVAGDILCLGVPGNPADFTALGVEEIINAAGDLDICVDVGDGRIYFKPDERVPVVDSPTVADPDPRDDIYDRTVEG